MAVPTWPETLPQRFLRPGNQESMADGRLVSATDTGPGKMRPRTDAIGQPFTGAMRMSGAQLEGLKTFIKTTLGKGTLPFHIQSPRSDVTWLARFAKGGLPSWTNIGGDRWNVTFTLEILQEVEA